MRLTLSLVLITLAACGGDDSDAPPDCEQTLDEWCDSQQLCEGYETRDEALASVLTDEFALLGARSCNDGDTIAVGDGLNGKVFRYAADGALIGVSRYSDALTGAACEPGNSGAGEPAACGGARCDLLLGLGADDEVDACTGDVAETLIAACLADPPALVEGCEECACGDCYPALLWCKTLEREDAGVDACADLEAAVECMHARCSDACSAQLAAIAD